MHFLRPQSAARAAAAYRPGGVHCGVQPVPVRDQHDFSLYEVGTRLLACGVIAGRDMTHRGGGDQADVGPWDRQRTRKRYAVFLTPILPGRSPWNSKKSRRGSAQNPRRGFSIVAGLPLSGCAGRDLQPLRLGDTPHLPPGQEDGQKQGPAPSAMGPAYITPSIPQMAGKMRMRGMRKIICRVREMRMPIFARPMAVKEVGNQRVQAVGKGHEHVDAEVFLCKTDSTAHCPPRRCSQSAGGRAGSRRKKAVQMIRPELLPCGRWRVPDGSCGRRS